MLVIGLILLIAGAAKAQMRPAPGPEVKKLGFLTGQYTTRSNVYLNGGSTEPAMGTGTATLRWGLDSMVVLLDESENNPALGVYKGFGIVGYDRHDGKYYLSMFNNYGDRPQYSGDFAGDTLLLTTTVPSPEGKFVQLVKWYANGNTLRLQVFNDFGQGPTLSVDWTATPANGADDVKK